MPRLPTVSWPDLVTVTANASGLESKGGRRREKRESPGRISESSASVLEGSGFLLSGACRNLKEFLNFVLHCIDEKTGDIASV